MKKNNVVFSIETLGVFLLGMTLVTVVSLIFKTDEWATATSICYAVAVISVPMYKASDKG